MNKCIAFVDDDEQICRYFREYAIYRGDACHCCHEAESALKAIVRNQEGVWAVCVDLTLPGSPLQGPELKLIETAWEKRGYSGSIIECSVLRYDVETRVVSYRGKVAEQPLEPSAGHALEKVHGDAAQGGGTRTDCVRCRRFHQHGRQGTEDRQCPQGDARRHRVEGLHQDCQGLGLCVRKI